ncbi:1059_t:CDS:2 [Ambispora leptoticha]|uniref:1059_t:CDS:1 n=1 Tax=Ambispora leptoticha TaxID=144679 RepID=A0A9N9E2B7_9GLOM|nr:1059_t:CDS:2 [Ambispora leptoticha]
MAEGADSRICETFQIRENCGSVRSGGQDGKPSSLSTDSNDNSMGRNMPSLDVLCQSALQEANITNADRIPCKEFGTLSREDCKDGTNPSRPSSDSKSHILEAKRKNSEVHVRRVNSLRTSGNGTQDISTSIEDENNEDITMGFKACPNQRTIEELQASFGKLCRIGTMGGITWTTEIPTKSCCLVLAHTYHTQGARSTIDGQESMSQVSKCVGQDETLCNNKLVVVDTFANDSDRRRLASFIGCELPSDSGDPKGLVYCYGRVFLWEDMSQMLWPMGNSLEEAKLNNGKDNLFWVVENDGIVYEFKLPPEHIYTTTKKGKSKKSKEKKHRKHH